MVRYLMFCRAARRPIRQQRREHTRGAGLARAQRHHREALPDYREAPFRSDGAGWERFQSSDLPVPGERYFGAWRRWGDQLDVRTVLRREIGTADGGAARAD